MESALIEWLKSLENGFIDDRVEIAETKYGRGLVARQGQGSEFSHMTELYCVKIIS